MTLGEKIRKFRQRCNLSQLSLATEMGNCDPAYISNVENNRKNPSKETIADLARALRLETVEIASLFGLDIRDLTPLMEETTRILSSEELSSVIDRTVNDLVFKLGYVASGLFLAVDGHIYLRGLTKSNMALKGLQVLDKPVDELRLSLKHHTDNLTVKVIRENREYLTDAISAYMVPAVSKEIADKVQEATGDKSTIIYPLGTNGTPFGAIAYVKKIKSDFRDERRTLKLVSKQISIAIANARKKPAA
ncbi:MAG: helix-turn-helix domain-containing protein [Nitrospinota bacterium]